MGDTTQTNFERLIFRQELNEVYLLLDFISGRPDKHLSDLDDKISNPEDGKSKLSLTEIVARVSAMRYPPAPLEAKKARDAAFLLYSAHVRIRKSLGEMIRKLSDTASQ